MINFLKLLDNQAIEKKLDINNDNIDWARIFPFIFLHLGCFAVFWVGVSWIAVIVAIFLYIIRIFSIGAFYHRYFSHKAFETNRFWQFVFALMGCLAIQRGPLWWAAHHRHHHSVTDEPTDPHSPKQHGFWRSHVGWFLTQKNFFWDTERVKDWCRYPELILLDRFDSVVSLLLALSLFVLGYLINRYWPQAQTSAWQMLVWGFFISTVVVFHVTVSINSIAHQHGKQTFSTGDDSRNNWWLALLTFGEGWHNNHHRYPASARQGFYWWEVDLTYYGLKLMEKIRIISSLRPVPQKILSEGKNHDKMGGKR